MLFSFPVFLKSTVFTMNEYLREYEFDDPSLGTAKVCQSPENGHGSTVWDAALVLCAFFESKQGRDLIKGSRVVELGSGTGIVSIVADRLGAGSTVATDLPEYVPFIRQNIGLNLDSKCKAASLDWKERNLAAIPDNVDWVLCADCVYLKDTVDDLVETILAINPIRGVIVSNETREHENNDEAERRFIKGLYEKGFVGKAVHREVLKPEWRCEDIHVVVFERKEDTATARVREL